MSSEVRGRDQATGHKTATTQPGTADQAAAREASSLRLWEAVRLSKIGSWVVDLDRRVALISPEVFRLHGLEPPVGAGGKSTGQEVTIDEWLEMATPASHGPRMQAIEDLAESGEPVDYEFEVKVGRSTRHILGHAEVAQRSGNRVTQIFGYVEDITARKRTEQRRRRTERELTHQQKVLERIARGETLEETLDRICRYVERLISGTRCQVLVLDRAAGVLRHGAAPTLDREYADAIDGLPVGDGMAACGTAAARGEVVIVEDVQTDPLTAGFTELGNRFNLRSVWSQPLRKVGGEVLGTLAVYRDQPHRPNRNELRAINSVGTLAALAIDRSHIEKALQSAANFDALTGLTNRARFLELVNEKLQDPDHGIAVVSIELNRFTQIAASLGHLAGDRILLEVADRLRSAVGSSGLVARFGEHEFTLMVEAEETAPVRQLADRVLRAIEEPIRLDGGEFFLSASIGIARNHDNADAFSLVRDADAAMTAARAGGPGRQQVYDRWLRARVIDRLKMESELRRAIERDELLMYYQPVLSLGRSRWSCVEALIRWQHPQRGLIGPDDFIPLAEETGLVVPLGERVLRMVVAQAKTWAERLPGLQLAANVSVVQLADPNFAESIAELISDAGLEPRTLQLEVTESALMHELETARSSLGELLTRGIDVLIDDFGTGYSSLARLGELPISGLKIDRSFTHNLGSDVTARKVVRAITELASAHSLEVVAEGIEDGRALEQARTLGCQYAQGFHVGRPMTSGVVAAQLARPVPREFGSASWAAA